MYNLSARELAIATVFVVSLDSWLGLEALK